jgi:hypothetical protein
MSYSVPTICDEQGKRGEDSDLGTEEGNALSKANVPTTKLLTAVALSCVLLLVGCRQTGSDFKAKEREPAASTPSGESPAGTTTTGGTEVGDAFAEAELGPVGDSDVSANVVFKEVGSLGVQVELDVSGLPASEGQQSYFAQVHGGSCSEAPRGGGTEPKDDHGDEPHGHEHAGAGPSLALLGSGPLLAMKDEYADHPVYEPPPADELPGNVDTPVEVVAGSSDGMASVTSLLEGVDPEELTSGSPKYMDLRAPSHEAPERWPALACADLGEGGD